MHKVLQNGDRILLSLSEAELAAISRSFTEICNSSQTTDPELSKKYGVSREEMRQVIQALNAEVSESRRTSELVQAWEDQGAVMVRVMNAWGDPVEMGEVMAGEFAVLLQKAIEDAS